MEISKLAKQVALPATLSLVFCLGLCTHAIGQGIHVQTPFNNISDSYYENFGVSFGFNLANGTGNGSRIVGIFPNGQINPNGIVFGQNSAGAALPPFGGFDPATGGSIGFGRVGGKIGYSLGLNFGKGSTRNATSVTPGVVVPNGGIGTFTSGQNRPFVTSVTPFTFGGYSLPSAYGGTSPSIFSGSDRSFSNPTFGGMSYSQIRAALSSTPDRPRRRTTSSTVVSNRKPSSAETSDISVAEIKAQRQAMVQAKKAKNAAEISRLLERAQKLEKEGNIPLARAQYYKAHRLAEGQQKREIKSKYESLRSLKKKRRYR